MDKVIRSDTGYGDYDSDYLLSNYCGFSLVPGALYAIWITLLSVPFTTSVLSCGPDIDATHLFYLYKNSF